MTGLRSASRSHSRDRSMAPEKRTSLDKRHPVCPTAARNLHPGFPYSSSLTEPVRAAVEDDACHPPGFAFGEVPDVAQLDIATGDQRQLELHPAGHVGPCFPAALAPCVH